MKIKRVEHIAIAVDSLRQSIDFLRNTFGLPLDSIAIAMPSPPNSLRSMESSRRSTR